MELMTPNTGAIFWSMLTFLALLLILRKLAWKPILTMLDEREGQIQASLDQARQAAEVSKNDIMQKAEMEASQLIERATREIQLSRDKAMAEMRDLAVELSMTATGKLIGKSLDKKDHQQLIEESMQQIGGVN